MPLHKYQMDISLLFIYKELNSHFEYKIYYQQVDICTIVFSLFI